MINLYTEFVRLMNKNFGNSIIHEHIFSDNFLRFIIIVLNLNIICKKSLMIQISELLHGFKRIIYFETSFVFINFFPPIIFNNNTE